MQWLRCTHRYKSSFSACIRPPVDWQYFPWWRIMVLLHSFAGHTFHLHLTINRCRYSQQLKVIFDWCAFQTVRFSIEELNDCWTHSSLTWWEWNTFWTVDFCYWSKSGKLSHKVIARLLVLNLTSMADKRHCLMLLFHGTPVSRQTLRWWVQCFSWSLPRYLSGFRFNHELIGLCYSNDSEVLNNALGTLLQLLYIF